MPIEGRIPLTLVPREIAPLIEGESPSYRATWTAAVDGRLPVEQVKGRYYTYRCHLTQIALTMGCRLKAPDATKPPRKAASAPASVAA